MTKAASDPRRDEPAGPDDDEDRRAGFSGDEAEDILDRSNPSSAVVFEILRREGEGEMDRPAVSLWWSGFAAGISIAFSLVAEGVLRAHLPDSPWRPLVVHAGYPLGFLIVVLGRQQLFTENTITAVLPVAKAVSPQILVRMARLWVIVLAANLVGTLAAAAFCRFTPAIPPDVGKAMLEVAQEGMLSDPAQLFWRAIPAGFLVAGMVWLLPTAEAAQFHVIALMTYVISVCGFQHVIAGSFEAFLLMMNGQLTPLAATAGFVGPALIGNILGGTGLFALLAYGQVAKEI
jgi:formate/nitrite transporter FocA (FNT family)